MWCSVLLTRRDLTPREIDPLEHLHGTILKHKTIPYEVAREEALLKWVNLHDLLGSF